MNVEKLIKKVLFWEILQGMRLTLKSMFAPPVTIQYPLERRPVSPGFRGLHALVKIEGTDKEKCIACGLCAAICPSQCISIYTGEDAEGKKVIHRYDIEVLRCIFCGFCVEACPVGAVVLTEHYEYSGYTREEFLMTKEKLLDNWDKYMAGEKGVKYLENFWRPMQRDFGPYEGQPVFKGSTASGTGSASKEGQ